MLTQEQRSAFDERGYAHLPGAFQRPTVDAVAERVWSHLELHRGIQREDPRTWDIQGPWVGLKVLKRDAPFESLKSLELCAAIDDLLGPGAWRKPKNWGGFLVNFPDCRPEEWSVPCQGWHVDFHYTYDPGSPFGLHVFTFLSEVGPRAGGTLVVRGSHRLVEKFVAAMTPEERLQRYSVLRKRFNASNPWLAELTSTRTSEADRRHFMERDHEIDGVSVRVEQLCGSPGDVVLTHPWMLHVTSPNAGSRPRFMLGQDVYVDQQRVGRELSGAT